MYLELTDISKKIGADEVLSGITLSMEKGKVYGLQGKNGCGKSMLMRVICGLVLPTVGEVKIDGKILGKEFSFPPSVGVFIEKPGFLDSYSGFQNLMMLASIKGQISGAEVKDVIKRVGLQDIIHFLRREMLDFTAFPVFFVSNLLLVQRKKYYFNRVTVSRNCSIVL